MKQFKPLQHDAEIDWLAQLFMREGVLSYLEIGSKFGGSLWRIAHALPKGSRLMSVDLPWGDRKSERPLLECIEALRQDGYQASVILQDSTDPAVVAMVGEQAPFDACFIDACHVEKYVRADWENYGPMCRIVAFHDIAFYRKDPMPPGKLPIDVPKVWNEIKKDYRHDECMLDPTGTDNGIGVIWRS